MAKFCGACGGPLDPVTGKCPNCDKEDEPKQEEVIEEPEKNEEVDLFCDKCGSKLDPNTGKCPNCDVKEEEKKEDNTSGQLLFCDVCGSKLDPVTGLCPNCSVKKEEGLLFCDKCGSKLDPVTGKCPNCDLVDLSKETVKQEKVKEPKNGGKGAIFIIAGVLLVALIGVGAFFILRNNGGSNNSLATFDSIISEVDTFVSSLKENSEISNTIAVDASENLQSEKVVLEYLSGKGFSQNDVVYDYSTSGEKKVATKATSDSDELHPQYFTSYTSSSEDNWNIYTVNGEIYANNSTNNVTLTETDHVTIYEPSENTFYELKPNGDTPIVIKTNEITSGVLDSLVASELAATTISTPESGDTTPTTVEKHVVDMEVWAIQPVYEFDDIDVDFETSYTSVSLNYPETPYFCFNNNNLYTATYEGGFIFVKGGKFGFANGIGEVVTEAKYTGVLDKFSEDSLYATTTGVAGKAEQLKANYYHEKEDYYGGLGGTGFPSYGFNTSSGQIEEVPNSEWNSSSATYFNLYEFALENGMEEGSIAVLKSSSDISGSKYYDGYVIAGEDDYINTIDISTDYSVYAVSENIITFAKYNNVSGTDKYYYDDRSKVYPLVRDQRITDVVYVNADGETIASGYETGYPFYGGYAAVKKDGKWGYIDTDGNVVVDFVFDKATPISDGKAWVIYNGKCGRMNIVAMIENNAIFNDEQIKTDEWTSNGSKYLEVTADVIKKRDQPTTKGYDDGNRVGKGSIEVYYEKVEADGYTWYKTYDQLWIADQNGQWIKEIN